MLRVRGAVVFFSLTLTACGTYRTGGGYRTGTGEFSGMTFKAPSDYSTGTDSLPESELRDARAVHGNRQNYVPRGPFKLYWPVAAVQVNRGFRPPDDPKHEGIDLGGRRGLPIMAAHDGVVIYAGNGFKGYGKMILVEYSDDWATLYGHLDSFAVREGQVVNAGDPLGGMGATGHATGVHLHFELMRARQPVDPLPQLTNSKQLAEQLRSHRRRPATIR